MFGIREKIIRMMVTHARWCVNITKWKPTKEEWLALSSSIANEELERINKFQFRDDAKSSLVGCALIRKFVSQMTEIPSNQLVMKRNSHGRPELCNEYKKTQKSWPASIDFNVSHSGDYCVLAGFCSQNKELNAKIGVDVTKIISKSGKELARFLDLMKRREFTAAEWATVSEAAHDRQKCINFTRLWCLKESYIKAIGLGLSFRLSRIDFRFPEQYKYHISMDTLKNNLVCGTSVLLDNEPSRDWRFHLTALDDEHIVSIAHQFETPISCDLDCVSPFEEISISSILNSLEPIGPANDLNWRLFYQRASKTA